MKKLVYLILGLGMFFVVACGNSASTEGTATDTVKTETTTTTTADTTVKVQ